LLLLQAARIAGELAVGADDAMTGNGGGVGILIECIADSAVASCFKLAGNLGVGDDLTLGNPGGEGPDFLVEGHLRRNLTGVDG